MKKYIWSLFLLLTCSCGGGGGSEPGQEPVMSKEFINVVQNAQLPGDGGSEQISISSNCNWSISNEADWLTVTPSSGRNNESVTLTAVKNNTGKERSTELTITGGSNLMRKVIVKQSKATESTNTQVPGPNDNVPPSI